MLASQSPMSGRESTGALLSETHSVWLEVVEEAGLPPKRQYQRKDSGESGRTAVGSSVRRNI